MKKHIYFTVLVILGVLPLNAQLDTLPLKPERFATISTTEGTFMNLDISPKDGSIVFELLGNIFLLPERGGTARQLTSGISWDAYPIFSPDGSTIAFISDRTGSRRIYTMNINGNNIKLQNTEVHDDLDGIYWVDQPREVGSGFSAQFKGNDTVVSLESKKLFHFNHHDKTAYYRNSNTVNAIDILSGELLNHIELSSEVKTTPLISPDGNYIAYVTRFDTFLDSETVNVLKIIDVRTSKTILSKKIGTYLASIPRFSFAGDSKYLIMGFGGKIHRISIPGGRDIIIPFKAEINLALGPYVYNTFDYNDKKIDVKHLRWYSQGDSIGIVSSLGKLYKIKDSSLIPLLKDIDHGQFYPGRYKNKVLYSSWDNRGKGYIWHTDMKGSKPCKLLRKSGVYKSPTWLGDTMKIAYISVKRNYERFMEARQTASLKIYDRKRDVVSTIEDSLPFSNSIIYNDDKHELFYLGNFLTKGRYKPLYSFNINSSQKKEFARLDIDVDQVTISPDKKYLAFLYKRNLHLADLRNHAPPYNLIPGETDIPISKISKTGAVDPWFINNSELSWLWGDKLYSIKIKKGIEHSAIQETGVDLNFDIKHNTQNQIFTDARIITMNGDEVIENAVLIINNDKIEQVGKASDISLPDNTNVISLKGKTIVPGFIDMHAHDGPPSDILALDWNRYLINLAYGITTLRDPSLFRDFQAYEQLSKEKEILAPRIFGADALTEPEYQIECYDDAFAWVQMQKSLGALYIKVHDGWNRRQRQWLVMAANDLDLNITGHAGSGAYGGGFYNLSILLDGYTGVEHYLPFGKYYKDLHELFTLSKIYLTPTIVNSGGEFGNYKSMMTINDITSTNKALWSGSKSFLNISNTNSFVPKGSRLKSEVKNLGSLQQNNTKLLAGSHGDLPGIEFHWELWSMLEGSISELEILRSATIKGAEGLGLQAYLGSIENGKLADFVILNSNPLEDIRATIDIYGIVSKGKFYLQEDLLERLNTHND